MTRKQLLKTQALFAGLALAFGLASLLWAGTAVIIDNTRGVLKFPSGSGPTANGEIGFDGTDVKIYSGGSSKALGAASTATSGPTTGVYQNLIVYSYTSNNVTVTADGITLNSTTSTTPLWLSSVSQVAAIGTSGLGGLDTGSEAASTWYAVYLVAKANAGAAPTAGIVLSTSATAPAMPVGMTHFVLVGFVRNDGASAFRLFLQRNKKIRWVGDQQAVISAGTATSPTSVDISALVPPVAIAMYGWVIPTTTNWFQPCVELNTSSPQWGSIGNLRMGDLTFIIPLNRPSTIYYSHTGSNNGSTVYDEGYQLP